MIPNCYWPVSIDPRTVEFIIARRSAKSFNIPSIVNVSSKKGLIWCFNILSTPLSLIKSRYCGCGWLLLRDYDWESPAIFAPLSQVITHSHKLSHHMTHGCVCVSHIVTSCDILPSQVWYHMIEQLLQAIPHCCPSVPAVCCTIRLLEKIKKLKIIHTICLLEKNHQLKMQPRKSGWAKS